MKLLIMKCEKKSNNPNQPEGFVDQPWIGSNYQKTRILVLGESWYGDWGCEHNSDQGYIAAYLSNKIIDRMYTKMANACGSDRHTYWNNIAFTNFVTWTGSSREDRPTISMYKLASERLTMLLQELEPKGVWILGKEQSEYSEPIVRKAGIICEVAYHPTGFGISNRVLGDSWEQLLAQTALM